MKEVQSLTGKVVALNRFVSKATDKCMPFFKVLKKAFWWTDECKETLAKLKEYLMKPPTKPFGDGREVIPILSNIQHYSKFGIDQRRRKCAEARLLHQPSISRCRESYPSMKKIAFELLVTSKKLCPYFQAHPIVVMTNQLIRKTMNKMDATGRLIQWAIELGQFDIEYRPQATIKAQYAVRLQFPTTNNEVEYEALLIGLSLTKALGVKNLIVQADSQLIIGQVKGDYKAKEERMQKYLRIFQQLSQHFDSLDFVQIPRTKNVEANFLARLASSNNYNATFKQCVEIKGKPSTEGGQVLKIKEQEEWMTPIIHYLKEGWLPEDKMEARKIHTRATHFVIINDVLYRRGYSLPYLRCTSSEEAYYVLHEGI
ncbi:uncharacterized protein LOC142606278 [Castanea sativa]|uniref:uncharacterized protein LOC142606278 n=1 Tax=Castanea sativa TaxID=21020 RepID=UPI003F64E935